jgi:17beta-estradiol 17-dehydrogenase / very-long-chain 3-oxoacyl-CoA reductase
VKTAVHTIDFAAAGEAEFEKFHADIRSLDVGVLGKFFMFPPDLFGSFIKPKVNNVGKSHNMPVDFEETPKDEMKDIVNVNVHGTLKVTHAILPIMVKRQAILYNFRFRYPHSHFT